MLIFKFTLLYLTVTASVARQIFGRFHSPGLKGLSKHNGPRCKHVKPGLVKGRCARRPRMQVVRRNH